jgi:hypothetical protein
MMFQKTAAQLGYRLKEINSKQASRKKERAMNKRILHRKITEKLLIFYVSHSEKRQLRRR